MREDLLLARAILSLPPNTADIIRQLVDCNDRFDLLNQVMGECASAG